jgi:hypothetical protein
MAVAAHGARDAHLHVARLGAGVGTAGSHGRWEGLVLRGGKRGHQDVAGDVVNKRTHPLSCSSNCNERGPSWSRLQRLMGGVLRVDELLWIYLDCAV